MLHQLAWGVGNRQEVDHLFAVAVEDRRKHPRRAGEHPQYNRGRAYYAVFFAAPGGLAGVRAFAAKRREAQ